MRGERKKERERERERSDDSRSIRAAIHEAVRLSGDRRKSSRE